MENNDVFSFSGDNFTKENNNTNNNFNYDYLNGIGQSDYENEDLFTDDKSGDANNSNLNYDNMFSTEVENNNKANSLDDILSSSNTNSNIENNNYYDTFENIYNSPSFNKDDSDINNTKTEDPVINLIGDQIYRMPINTNYIENGVTINVDPTDTTTSIADVKVDGIVDNTKLGDYTITYTITDKYGKSASVSRTVQVLDDLNNNGIIDLDEEHYKVDFLTDGNGILKGNLVYDNILSGLTFDALNIQIPTPVALDGFEFKGFIPFEPTPDTVVNSNLTFTAMFDPVNVVNNEASINEEIDNKDNYVMPYEESNIEEPKTDESEKVEMSDTPIEEINKLTEYTPENIEETNMDAIFDKVSLNVKEASDIFKKNTDMKKKIDTRFEELKNLQQDIEEKKKHQIDEINAYKDEVYLKLTEKKDEIEKRLNKLKELQANFDKEKTEFEEYRKSEKENIEKVKAEVQSAYDERREELNKVEDVLRKQKDSLDEQRNQLNLDRIQYESDKNDLANNLLKFNELVDSFTNGVDKIS